MLTLLAGAFGAGGAAASTKVKGKVRACVIKKGEDKGLMRFAPKGKCKRGEKKLTWNKRGKRGKRGATGATGPAAGAALLRVAAAAPPITLGQWRPTRASGSSRLPAT